LTLKCSLEQGLEIPRHIGQVLADREVNLLKREHAGSFPDILPACGKQPGTGLLWCSKAPSEEIALFP